MTDTYVRPLQRLAETLRDQREVLTNRWIKSELRDTGIGHCDALTYEQLADHIPVILDQICYLLESEHLNDVEVAIERDATEHGHWRWKQGYRLDELIRELDLFRRVLSAAIATFAEVNHDFTRSHESHARDLVDDAVNLVMLTSVRQLVGEQKEKSTNTLACLRRQIVDSLRSGSCSPAYISRDSWPRVALCTNCAIS